MTIWDDIAAAQAAQKTFAESIRISDLETMNPEHLVDLFQAICSAGESYDPELKKRWRILDLLPDRTLVRLAGIRMPSKLAFRIERRLLPPICG